MPGGGCVPRQIVDVDWERYAETFPDRYLDPSPFDAQVQAVLADRQPATVLDIGGGTTGTRCLNQPHLTCWLLDPGIAHCPAWMQGNLDWEQVQGMRFNAIVARGSFNYLTRDQIRMIPDLLQPGGVFLANTFYHPRSGSRSYVNRATGVQGTERFTYHADEGLIVHELEPVGEEIIIRHRFFVYSLDDIIALLGTAGLSITFLRANSVCISLRRAGDG
jgi:hypothetical protein